MTESPKINNAESRFEFVAIASARAHQLLRGCLPKVEGSAQPARRAQQEVAAGVVARTDEPVILVEPKE
ncbi:MAG: DNA-directed RNA polymerase subunit omega [Acidobacteria bacterium]|jgi:DNA-directed RNA polymerase subunit K/omega|nr:DNA-directed RNA polymerase subunit omega [Acidobacteriota bacterium]